MFQTVTSDDYVKHVCETFKEMPGDSDDRIRLMQGAFSPCPVRNNSSASSLAAAVHTLVDQFSRQYRNVVAAAAAPAVAAAAAPAVAAAAAPAVAAEGLSASGNG